jgi:deoxyribonuclease-4
MFYLGPGGLPTITEGDTIQGLKDLKKLDLNALEIEFVRGVYLKKDKALEIGKLAKKLGIKLSIHAPYFINLCNPQKIKMSQKRILDSCEIAHYLEAEYVVFHPGYYGALSPEKAYYLVKKSCEELVSIIDKNRWSVTLGLETTGKKSQFGTLEENLQISKEINGCAPVIDFAHIFARNSGKIDFGEVLDKVKNFKELHTHFSGIEFTEKGEKRHLEISVKKPNFEDLARELVNRGFNKKKDITIISESPILEQDSLKMKKILEKLK